MQLRESKNGKAVFTKKDFQVGEKVTAFTGKKFYYDEIEDGSYIDNHSI